MRESFDIWYKNQVESGSKMPPDTLWEDISTELDIDDVWTRIANRFRWESILSYSGTAAAVVVVIIISSLLVVRFSASSPEPVISSLQETDAKEEVREPVQEQQSMNRIESVQEQQTLNRIESVQERVSRESKLAVENKYITGTEERLHEDIPLVRPNSTLATLQNSRKLAQVNMETTTDKHLVPSAEDNSRENIVLPKLSGSEYSLTGANSPDLSLTVISGEKEDPNYHRWSAGGFLTGKNSWLFNSKTISGLKSKSLTSSLPYYVANIGGRLVYDIRPLVSIQAEGLLHSSSGQNYKEYLHGEYTTRRVTLNWWELSLQSKYRLSVRPHRNGIISHNLSLGPYLAGLWDGSETIGEKRYDITDEYRQLDYGFILGYDLEYPLMRHFALSPGLRVHLGLPNIYKGNSSVPATLRLTRTASFEFLMSLDYKF